MIRLYRAHWSTNCERFAILRHLVPEVRPDRDLADDELFHRVLDGHQSLDGLPRLAAWIDRVDALPRAYGETVAST